MLLARAQGPWQLAVLAFSVLVAAAPARAQEPTFSLSYERHADAYSCISEPKLKAAVAKRIGRDPFVSRASHAIAVRIEPSPYGYVAEMALYEDGALRGERVLSSTGYECAPLGDALTLTLAIAIDPTHGLRPPAPASAPESPRKMRPLLRAADKRVYAPVPELKDAGEDAFSPALEDDPTSLAFELGAGAFGGIGAAPGAVVGGVVQGGARSGPLSFHLELRAEFPGSVPIAGGADYPQATVSGTLLAVALQPCFRLASGPLLPNERTVSAAVCGVAQTGALFVAADNIRDPSTGLAPWLSFGARLHLNFSLLDWLVARVFVEVAVPVTRVILTDRVSGLPLYEPPFLNLAVGLTALTLLR